MDTGGSRAVHKKIGVALRRGPFFTYGSLAGGA